MLREITPEERHYKTYWRTITTCKSLIPKIEPNQTKKDHEEIKQKEGLKGIELDGLFIA